jgi:hypothetical protein
MTESGPGTGGCLAVVTPSHRGDWPLFCELHESVLEHAPAGTIHQVIVPDLDVGLFQAAAGPRCQVVPETSLYPAGYMPVPRVANTLLRALPGFPATARIAAVNRRHPLRPVRGWVMQQALKLEACARSDADVVLLLDSDVALVRPVHAAALRHDGIVRFYRQPGAIDATLPRHAQWHAVARRLLGLAAPRLPAPDYVSSLAVWDPLIVRQLLARVAQVAGEPWMDAVTRLPSFSEWTLYGVYIDEFCPAAARAAADSSLCHSYWTPAPLTAEHAADFVARARPTDIAILIQSKSGTPIEVRRAALRSFTAGSTAGSRADTSATG